MNGSELYQYILNNTLHELRGTWEVTQDNKLKVTGTNVNGSYVVFPDALTDFSLEWDMTILSSGGSTNSGISPIILSSYQGSNLEGWNNGSTITNAKFAYFLCNHRNTANFGSILIHNNGTAQGGWQNSTYQNTFNVGTKYRYKLERKNGLFNLYQDNILVSSFIDITNNIPIYLGWYMWWGGTYTNLQANFIIDNYVVTYLSTDTTKYLNDSGLSEVWTNTKNYIAAQLLGKQDTLVSGTNIKTVNNQSLLGSGNVSFTPPTFAYDSSTETLSVSNTTATVFNYDSNTETLEIQVNG